MSYEGSGYADECPICHERCGYPMGDCPKADSMDDFNQRAKETDALIRKYEAAAKQVERQVKIGNISPQQGERQLDELDAKMDSCVRQLEG